MKTVLVTPATLLFFREYSQFGDESSRMRVGDTVIVRREHEEWVEDCVRRLEDTYQNDGPGHTA